LLFAARAPVFSHVSASLYGLPTIRSANAQGMIINEFDSLQDQHSGSWFLFIASSETFGFYLDIISMVFLTIVTYQFLIFDDGTTKSGNVGLVISQSLILTGMLQYGVRQAADVASNMTSVERILQYTKLDKEGPFESLPTKKPPRDWPQQGHVVFRNAYLSYAPEEPPVLKNLNVEILPAEKVRLQIQLGSVQTVILGGHRRTHRRRKVLSHLGSLPSDQSRRGHRDRPRQHPVHRPERPQVAHLHHPPRTSIIFQHPAVQS
jgi:ATP-binding cassette subfamily C (CFTR/MRP) protein 4